MNSGHQSGHHGARMDAPELLVLIPLNSGHQSGLPALVARYIVGGLNPFEFRASVRTSRRCHHDREPHRLNPFEFRASVRTPIDRETTIRGPVLIPLNSGHQSGLQEVAQDAEHGVVLIPLNSGHQSGRGECTTSAPYFRLNPFEFRASVRTAKLEDKLAALRS